MSMFNKIKARNREAIEAHLSDNFIGRSIAHDTTYDKAGLGDRDQIKQAFFNLIKNAMEAMQPAGSLRILARRDDDYVYLQFVDTGSGISEEDLSKVFQAYYTTKEEGHGLGMMIVERIMREHGGHINIESRKEAGTAITLQFPQKHRRTRLLE